MRNKTRLWAWSVGVIVTFVLLLALPVFSSAHPEPAGAFAFATARPEPAETGSLAIAPAHPEPAETGSLAFAPARPEPAETGSLAFAPARPEPAETGSLAIAPAHPEPAETGSLPVVPVGTEHDLMHHHEMAPIRAIAPIWEGSAEGVAYSEFNHHLAGFFVILIGLSELRPALGIAALSWTRLLLPGALFVTGIYLLIWSDHDAWPVGSLSFAQTFVSDDWETIQHKLFGIVALLVGTIELFRRMGRLEGVLWRVPLPAFAIVGGLSLFLHSHGVHPAAHKIAIHHAVMGIMAITAGSSKFFSEWKRRDVAMLLGSPRQAIRSPWELAWAAFVLLIGIQLLIYAE